jgi:hypothetical protein
MASLTPAGGSPPFRPTGAIGGPSLVIVNARVKTNDQARPWASGLAVAGERINAVGSSAELMKVAAPNARIVDAGGRILLAASPDGNDPAPVKIERATPATFMIVDREPPADSTWANPGYKVFMRVVRGMVLEDTL